MIYQGLSGVWEVEEGDGGGLQDAGFVAAVPVLAGRRCGGDVRPGQGGEPGEQQQREVGPGRGAGLVTGPFPRAASRVG